MGTPQTTLFNPKQLAKLLMGNLAAGSTFLAQALYALLRGFKLNYGGDGAANTTVAETIFAFVDCAVTLTGISIVPAGALTQSHTVYATITIGWRKGSTLQTVATITTDLVVNGGTGSWTSQLAGSGDATISVGGLLNTAVPAGAVLTYSIAKASTGTQLPPFMMSVLAQGT